MTEMELAVAMYQVAQIERGHWRMAEMVDNMQPVECKAGGRTARVSAQDYIDCAAKGMTISQTAKHLGVSESAAQHMRRTYKITFRHGNVGKRK